MASAVPGKNRADTKEKATREKRADTNSDTAQPETSTPTHTALPAMSTMLPTIPVRWTGTGTPMGTPLLKPHQEHPSEQ